MPGERMGDRLGVSFQPNLLKCASKMSPSSSSSAPAAPDPVAFAVAAVVLVPAVAPAPVDDCRRAVDKK